MENSNYKNKNIEKKQSNSWYDWLMNYILEPIKKMHLVLKINLQVFLRKAHLNKVCMGEKTNSPNQKHTHKKKPPEENIGKIIRNPFIKLEIYQDPF